MTTAKNMLLIIRTNSVSYPSTHCIKVNEERLVTWKTKTIKLLISLPREMRNRCRTENEIFENSSLVKAVPKKKRKRRPRSSATEIIKFLTEFKEENRKEEQICDLLENNRVTFSKDARRENGCYVSIPGRTLCQRRKQRTDKKLRPCQGRHPSNPETVFNVNQTSTHWFRNRHPFLSLSVCCACF